MAADPELQRRALEVLERAEAALANLREATPPSPAPAPEGDNTDFGPMADRERKRRAPRKRGRAKKPAEVISWGPLWIVVALAVAAGALAVLIDDGTLRLIFGVVSAALAVLAAAGAVLVFLKVNKLKAKELIDVINAMKEMIKELLDAAKPAPAPQPTLGGTGETPQQPKPAGAG